MADQTEAPAKGPEPIRGFFSSLLGWVDSYTKIKKFLRTRNAVLQGQKIFDLSSQELKATDLMGPLTFNVYESTLAALPAAALGVVLGVFLEDRPESLQLVPGASEFSKALATEALKILPKVTKTIQPFVPPFFLLIAAWTAAWGCLKQSDSSGLRRRRSRDAFLYYDGAYGLWVQAVLSLGIGLLLVPTHYVLDNVIPLIAGRALLVFSLMYQVYLANRKIPRLLFQDNCYDIKFYHFWNRVKPANRAPWSRYSCAIVLSSLLGCIAVVALIALQVAAAYSVAFFVVWLRVKITGHA